MEQPMFLKEELQKLINNEEYSSLNTSFKYILSQSVGLEIYELINKEKSQTPVDSKINQGYANLSKFIKENFELEKTVNGKVDIGNKELTDRFMSDVRKLAVRGLNQFAEYKKMIAIPESGYDGVALVKITAMLKARFNVNEEDVSMKSKFRA